MALSAVMSNHFKYALANGQINLSAHSIKCLLMRSGYAFNRDNVAQYKNVGGSLSASFAFDLNAKTVTVTGGNFVTAGFVPGNRIVISGTGGNNGEAFIASSVGAVTSSVIQLVDNPTNAQGGTETGTLTIDDELSDSPNYGYTRNTKTLTYNTVTRMTEDDTNDRFEFQCDEIKWTASGGSIGPTAGAILYDDTDSEKTVIGFLDFNGDQTATDGVEFVISGVKVRIV